MTGKTGGSEEGGGAGKRAQASFPIADLAGAGVQFAAILVLSAFAGIWVDRRLKTTPWFLIILVFAGAALAFYSLYHKLMSGQRLGDRRKSEDRRE